MFKNIKIWCFYIVLLFNLVTNQPLAEYAQCNGENWSSPIQCKIGLKCQRKDRWYSQCLKACPSDWECNSQDNECIESSCINFVSEYGQCGGVNYKGATKCSSGLNCFKYNKWYSQCLKKCPCGWECCEKPVLPFVMSSTSTSSRSTSFTKLSLLPSNKPFPNCVFKYGRNYRKDHVDYSGYDYISLWLGKINSFCVESNSKNLNCTDFDHSMGRDEIEMLNTVNTLNKIAVFKTYIIGFEAKNFYGLRECDSDQSETLSLCWYGSKFIRENRKFILDKYSHFISRLQPYLIKTSAVFIIEPNFWNYYGQTSQIEGPLKGIEMRKLFDDICDIIKTNIPHALISWDASMWLNESDMMLWWSYFQDSKYIDFIYTSSSHYKNSLSLQFMKNLTQKLIMVESDDDDDGISYQNKWYKENFINKKIQDGVISFGFNDPNQIPLHRGNLCS